MLKLRLPKKIAVTGGIASGKSTVCYLFEELGAYVVSADNIVHRLLVPNTHIGKKIIALLGDDIVVDKALSRTKIAQRVFNSPQLLSELEKTIHPEVQRVIVAEYKKASQKKFFLFVAEIPLLYEAGMENFYDTVIVVTSDKENCWERFRGSKEDYLIRNQRLMPIEKKIQRADLLITNNGNIDELRQTVQITYSGLILK